MTQPLLCGKVEVGGENMEGYIYKTTNILNGKMYIGKKKSNKFNPNYYGSGKLLKEDINRYGKENFVIEIIEVVEDINILSQREKYYINICNAVADPRYYNISKGGEGVIAHNKRTRKIQSKTMQRVNELGLNTNWKNGHPKGMKGKKQTSHQKEKVGKGRVITTLPDGQIKEYESAKTGAKALNIGERVIYKCLATDAPYKNPKNFPNLSVFNGLIVKYKQENTEVTK